MDNRSNNSKIKVWAHRGCSYQHQENTLPAFLAACKLQGITGIELDIQLTADKEIIVFHDEKIDRLTVGTGRLCDYTLSELKNLRFKNTEIHADGAEVSIPTMEEVLEQVKPYSEKYGVLINIELKNSHMRYECMEEKILNLVSDYNMKRYVIYSSFNGDSLCKLKELDAGISAGILKRTLEDCISFGKNNVIDAYHPSIESMEVSGDLPDHAVIRVWNEEEPFYGQKKSIRLYDLTRVREKGATDIITNVPEMYLKLTELDT